MGCCGSASGRYGAPETAAVLPDAKSVQREPEPSTGDQTEEPSVENVEAIEPLKAQKVPAAGPETSVEPSVQHWQGAQPSAQESKEWQRPATWPAPKEVPPPGPDAPHVVLSTKFEEPWGTISRGLKEILEELGCTVYNPNTDNKEPGPGTLPYDLSFSQQ